MTFSRRAFLASAAAGALAPASARTLKNICAQLYTVRTVLPEKPLETLQALDKIGYREVEVTQAGLDKIWPALKKTRMKPVSIHIDAALLAPGKDAELDAAVADAKKRGFDYVGYPVMLPADRGGAAEMRSFAARLNHLGIKCRDAGMKLCYHNHAFEFDPKDGKTPLELIMEGTDREVVGLELDIFWASVAGHNPAALLEKYAGRVPLLHLKDKPADQPVLFDQSVPRTAFKEVGAGSIDIAGVLRAAQAAGVRHYIVEQDQTPGDPVESMRQSFDYLRKLEF
jgi:sugar phosphate isomerase/epimerase